MNGKAAEDAAAALLAAGRPKEALTAIEAVARAPDASHTALVRHAGALKALDRLEDCLAVRRLATARFPQSGVAWHNLASTLADLGRGAEAAEACRRALASGLDAPETWLVNGRALAVQGRSDEALAALDEALRRRPGYPDALASKASLTWAATGDIDKAAAVYPQHPAFALPVADLYKTAGRAERAVAVVEAAVGAAPDDPHLQQALAALALEAGDVERAMAAANIVRRLAPGDTTTTQTWAAVCLAAGRAEEALEAARQLVAARPLDQSVLALCAVAARLAGAPEYERLYDYDAFVRGARIAAPKGWPSVEAFLADLKATLETLHEGSGQPLEQSLRHGTQTNRDLRAIDSPVLSAFFAAIDPLIRRYMADLGEGADPLRVRNTGAYEIAGAWSIRLRSEGYHVDHMHPRGWLSSAFYVAVPPETQDPGSKAGWLQFGRPSLRTRPTLEPAHFERPAPGKLLLFPSYMWHGTLPFRSDEHRMTIAFDIVPA